MECAGEVAAGGGVAGVLETVPDEKDGGCAEADSQAAGTGKALEAGAAEGAGTGAAEGWNPSEVRTGNRGQWTATPGPEIRTWGTRIMFFPKHGASATHHHLIY